MLHFFREVECDCGRLEDTFGLTDTFRDLRLPRRMFTKLGGGICVLRLIHRTSGVVTISLPDVRNVDSMTIPIGKKSRCMCSNPDSGLISVCPAIRRF